MQAVDVKTREVVMPALSSTMTEGKIVQWLKRPGDPIVMGEPIMVVESDKADMDVEAFEEGFLATIIVDEGQSCPVGEAVALIVDSSDDVAKVTVSSNGTATAATLASVTTDPEPTIAQSAPPTPTPATPTGPSAGGSAPKPDFIEVAMPALSSTMTEGKIVDWLKAEGDAVEAGEMIMVVESDKADMDVEAFDGGILAHIAVPGGESAPVGSPVAFLAKTPADVAAIKAWANSAGSSASVAAPVVEQAAAVAESPAVTEVVAAAPAVAQVVNEGRIIASPRAKVVAKELGVDLKMVPGTGPGSRIVEKDVRSFSASGASAATTTTVQSSGKMVATPDAKKLAKKEGVDLSTVKGTGNFGRVTADDVLRAAGKAPVAAAPKATKKGVGSEKAAPSKKIEKAEIPGGSVVMNAMQKAVVSNMNASLSVPVFRITYAIRTGKLDELYAQVKPKGVTMSALLAKAVALALRKHPIMNAAYVDDAVLYREDINISMAVSTPDGGLITPTLKKADEVDLYSLSRTWKDMVKRASDKKLKPDEYSGGTFVISNLGMFGVQQFDAILPPGVPGILAVGAAQPTVRMMDNGLVGVEKVMNVTLTADHRHIYGADGAKFLKDFAAVIEGDVIQLLM